MQVLNFYILYAKYYNCIQRLFNNNTLDLSTCLKQLKQALKEKICNKNNRKEKFFKYNFIYENLLSNNEDIICNYVSNTVYTLPKKKRKRVFKIPKHKRGFGNAS